MTYQERRVLLLGKADAVFLFSATLMRSDRKKTHQLVLNKNNIYHCREQHFHREAIEKQSEACGGKVALAKTKEKESPLNI